MNNNKVIARLIKKLDLVILNQQRLFVTLEELKIGERDKINYLKNAQTEPDDIMDWSLETISDAEKEEVVNAETHYRITWFALNILPWIVMIFLISIIGILFYVAVFRGR